MTVLQQWLIVAGLVLVFTVAMIAVAPTQADIQNCIDSSNYSKETCLHVLKS